MAQRPQYVVDTENGEGMERHSWHGVCIVIDTGGNHAAGQLRGSYHDHNILHRQNS